MPQDPRTWSASDFVSASYLDYDLYAAGSGYPVSQQFIPNGIRWHSQRAVYKAVQISSQTLAASVWKNIFGTVPPAVIYDSCGLYGAHMDPAHTGVIEDVVLSSGGGLPLTTGGGWYLMSGSIPVGSTASTAVVAAGLTQDATLPRSYGLQLKGNTVYPTTPWVCDLVLSGSSTWTLAAFQGGGSTANLSNVPDGSGNTPYFFAHWAGTKVGNSTSAPAPIRTWTSASTVTAALLNGNTGIRDVLRNLNYPPMFRATDTTGVSVPNATATTIGLTLGTNGVDNYSGYSSPTYTVPQTGLYLVHGIVFFSNFGGQAVAGVSINGTDYWGPARPSPSSGDVSAAKLQMFSLNAGDTISLRAYQTSGTTQTTNISQSCRLVVLKVSGTGTPSPLPVVPDTTFRWAAGLQPDLSSTLNAYLANDLTFLTYKPYLMSYQTVATTGIPMGTTTKVIMNNATGQVHGDSGDNYSGYNTGTGVYTVQRAGWYMVTGEIFMAYPTLTTNPTTAFALVTSPHGTTGADFYEQGTPTSATNPGGVAAIGYYYFRVGDTIAPYVYSNSSSATTTSTSVSPRNSHLELVWISE